MMAVNGLDKRLFDNEDHGADADKHAAHARIKRCRTFHKRRRKVCAARVENQTAKPVLAEKRFPEAFSLDTADNV